MSTRTIYKCDRCGVETEDPQQFWLVGFMVTTDRWISTSNTNALQMKREWCRACVEEFEILPRVVTKPPQPPEQPKTIEDLIREIVQEERAQQ